MKKLIRLTMVFCLSSQWALGQNCINEDSDAPCCNGIIRTDPREQHTSNTERPALENNFDWRPYGDFDVYHPDGGYWGGTGVPYSLGNPFFKNLSYLKHINNFPAVPSNQGADSLLDFHPEDGWELLHRNMGFEPDESTLTPLNLNNRPGPYFILYNRYTGVLRILANLDQIGAHQTIETRLDFVEGLSEIDGDSLHHAAYFGHYGNTSQTLDQKSASRVARGSNYPELKGWWVADFTMAYDPCICNNQSKLTINFSAIDSASIQMGGRLIGTSTTLNGSGSSPLLNGEDFLLAVKKDGFNVNGGMQTYHNIDKLVDKYTAPPGLTDAQKFLLKAFGNVLKSATSGIIDPFVDKKISAAGSSLLDTTTIKKLTGKDQFALKAGTGSMVSDFFMGKLKPEEFKVPNISFIEGELLLSGVLIQSTKIESAEIILRTPGSYRSNDTSIIWQQYPAYNEALGVVSVLEKPKVSTYMSLEASSEFNGPPFINDYLRQYQLDSIKLKFNPAAEIDFERSSAHAAFVMDIASNAIKVGDFYKNIGFQDSSSGFRQYITDFFPLGCMGNVAATIHRRDSASAYVGPHVPISTGTPKLRILFDYYSKPNRYGKVNHTIQVITLDLDIDYKNYPNNDPNDISSDDVRIFPSFTEYPDIIEIGDTIFTQSDTISAWSNIFVQGNVSTSPGVKVVFIAPNIDLSQVSSFDPGLEFLAESLLPCMNSGKLTEVSNDVVKAFCNSTKYAAKTALNKYEPFEEEEKDRKVPKLATKVYPNPSTGEFKIVIEDELNGEINVQVFDFTGRIIDSMRTFEHQLTIDLSGQSRGIYFIKIYNELNSTTSKLVLVQ